MPFGGFRSASNHLGCYASLRSLSHVLHWPPNLPAASFRPSLRHSASLHPFRQPTPLCCKTWCISPAPHTAFAFDGSTPIFCKRHLFSGTGFRSAAFSQPARKQTAGLSNNGERRKNICPFTNNTMFILSISKGEKEKIGGLK